MTIGAGRDEEFADYVRARRSHLLATAYLLSDDRQAAEELVRTALGKLYVAWPRVHRSESEDAYARQVLVKADLGSRVPADQRRVVVLRHWLGLSVEEVALELDISTGAVESRLAEAATGPDLADRMTESTSWTELERVDPAADLLRGRRYLQQTQLRRRLGLAGAAVLAVAAIVAGTSALSGPSTEEAPAGPPPIPTRPERASLRLASWFSERLDPQHRYITATDSDGGDERSGLQATMIWRQGAGIGRVAVSLTPPGRYDKGAGSASSKHCQVLGRTLADGPPYNCRPATKDGHRVLTGTADVGGVRSYFAGYVRPDGYLVIAAVEGRQVRDLAVDLEDVVDAVTDPAVPMP